MQNKVRSLVEQMKYLALQSEKLLSRRIWTNITNSNPRLARLQVEKHRPHNLENHPHLQRFRVGLERYNEFFCWNLVIKISDAKTNITTEYEPVTEQDCPR